jgi:hypothetical protein
MNPAYTSAIAVLAGSIIGGLTSLATSWLTQRTVPRLRHIGLMEFNRAEEAIAEGRLCVEQALPMLKRFV